MAKKAKRNPNDVTFRNHRAHEKRIATLERQVAQLQAGLKRRPRQC